MQLARRVTVFAVKLSDLKLQDASVVWSSVKLTADTLHSDP